MSDTLTALQQALSPKTGMRRIPFPLESYEHPSLPLVAKRLINLMGEKQPADARTVAALISTPALQPWSATMLVSGVPTPVEEIGTGPILAVNDDMPGVTYIVSGTGFYRLQFMLDGTVILGNLGDIGTPTLPGDTTEGPGTGPWNAFPTIAVSPTGVVVCCPPNAYSSSHNRGDPLGQITDPDFPGASSVAYVGGYFAFSSIGNTSQWFISALADPLAFDALDFAFSDAVPNIIRRVIGHRGQLWTIGEAGFQVWFNAGTSGLETTPGISFFPFQPVSGGIVPIGTTSPMSLARADQALWWVGVDGLVYRTNGYTPERVSTHAIEAIIGDNATGLHGFSHPFRGHWSYCLTTAAGDRTLIYDIATSAWHERSTSVDGVGPWQAGTAPWRGGAPAANGSPVYLLGDRTTGRLYTLDTQPDDAGVTVIRQATFPPLLNGANPTDRVFCARVEVEMESGGAQSPGPVLLRWSDDGGRTYNAGRTMQAGAPGDYKKRVYTTRLGSFRQRVFRLTTHGLTRFYAVSADLSPGSV